MYPDQPCFLSYSQCCVTSMIKYWSWSSSADKFVLLPKFTEIIVMWKIVIVIVIVDSFISVQKYDLKETCYEVCHSLVDHKVWGWSKKASKSNQKYQKNRDNCSCIQKPSNFWSDLPFVRLLFIRETVTKLEVLKKQRVRKSNHMNGMSKDAAECEETPAYHRRK